MWTKLNSTLECHGNGWVKITRHLRCLLIFTQPFPFHSRVSFNFYIIYLEPCGSRYIIPTITHLATYCRSISGTIHTPYFLIFPKLKLVALAPVFYSRHLSFSSELQTRRPPLSLQEDNSSNFALLSSIAETHKEEKQRGRPFQ